ncbi:MAG TPA: response regulator transcription factor [Gaiellales bacterium]|jgi:DNA-binding response OmpR family regulator|nr:response regulator transcription factor [Gaiellales bacterium]
MKILVIEDETLILAFLERGLAAEGHAVDTATRGEEGLDRLREGHPDIVVLDIMLPGIDGFDVLAAIRAIDPELPVILLTARDEVADRVRGLDLGATDYLVKPFAFAELAARVRAHTRRPADQRRGAASIEVGPLSLDLLAREAEVDGVRVSLSAREFALLAYLMRHPGQVLSRQQILDGVWGYTFDPRSNLVDVYIGYLRRKLTTNGYSPIQTVRGMGYRLVRERAA